MRANSVRLPEHVWKALGAEAKARKISRNHLIHEAVVTYLAHVAAVENRPEAVTYEELRGLVEDLL